MSREGFWDNALVQDAVVRQFEVIGEATKKVSPELRERYSSVPWSVMAKMRDVLIHHEWEVDLDVVWVTSQRDLPELVALLQSTLK